MKRPVKMITQICNLSLKPAQYLDTYNINTSSRAKYGHLSQEQLQRADSDGQSTETGKTS